MIFDFGLLLLEDDVKQLENGNWVGFYIECERATYVCNWADLCMQLHSVFFHNLKLFNVINKSSSEFGVFRI